MDGLDTPLGHFTKPVLTMFDNSPSSRVFFLAAVVVGIPMHLGNM
jgi:hypothetical protein